MITYEGPGNLFRSGTQCITCPVNTVGAMGKGIALTFKKHVPGLYAYYRNIYCDEPPNYPSIHRLEMFHVDQERSVLLLPTKNHWQFPSKRGLIDDNLRQLAERYEELGIRSLGLPAIGCGFETGQLSWERDVRPLVYRHLDPLPIPVKIFVN